MTLTAIIVLALALLALFLYWTLTAPEACERCGAEGCDGSRAKCPERFL